MPPCGWLAPKLDTACCAAVALGMIAMPVVSTKARDASV
jgi:hypothetical protein